MQIVFCTLYARNPDSVSSTANLYHPRWDIIGSLVQIWFPRIQSVASFGPYDMVLHMSISYGSYHANYELFDITIIPLRIE